MRVGIRHAVLLAALVAPGVLVASSTACQAQIEADASAADMTFFYRTPSPALLRRIIRFIDHIPADKKRGAVARAYGFLAGGFLRYPDALDQIIPDDLSTDGQAIVAVGLALAGQAGRAGSIVGRLRLEGAPSPDLARLPRNLDAVPAEDAKLVELLWGASFATGDGKYCQKILDAYVAVANQDGNAADLMTIARGHGLNGEALQQIMQTRGPRVAQTLMSMGSALWSLHANAQLHDFVRQVVSAYVTAHPKDHAAEALLRV